MRNPTIFLHLPKTGGTTLRDVIVRQFRGQTAFRFDGGDHERAHFAGLSQAERDSFALVEGHLYHGVHSQLTRPARSITMLRDPVERVLSYYWFVLRTPEHYAHARFKELGSLSAAIERTRNHELDNFQVRLLAGEGTRAQPKGNLDPAWLDTAKQSLSEYSVVGLTEKFEESLALLSVEFGWTDLVYHRFKKTSERPRPEDLPPRELRLIREANALDFELYEHAQALFEKQVAEAGPAFGSALSRVRSAQAAWELRGEAPPPEPKLVGGVWRL